MAIRINQGTRLQPATLAQVSDDDLPVIIHHRGRGYGIAHRANNHIRVTYFVASGGVWGVTIDRDDAEATRHLIIAEPIVLQNVGLAGLQEQGGSNGS